MKKLFLTAALSALFAGQALAAPQTYVVDSSHTFPRFSYDHMGLSKQILSFTNTTGSVVLDQDAKDAKVEITVDTTSVYTGFEAFNGHIQGEDFLDTAQFPIATFKSSKAVFEGDQLVKIEGDLTIKGITKPVTLNVTSFYNGPHPMVKKAAVGANAIVVISRSEFNAGKFAPTVGDEVTLDISLEAIAE